MTDAHGPVFCGPSMAVEVRGSASGPGILSTLRVTNNQVTPPESHYEPRWIDVFTSAILIRC